MKILFIHTRYLHSVGGEDTVVDAEIELLKSKEHQVDLLLFDNGTMAKNLSGKIKAAASSIYNRSSAKILKLKISNFKPDIIHVHNFFFTASPSIIYEAKRNNIPVVVTIHNFRLICSNSLLLRDNHVCELCIKHDFAWHGVRYKCYHNSAVQSAIVAGMGAIHKWIGTFKNKVDFFITPSNFMKSKLITSSFNAPKEKIKVKYNFIKDPGYSKFENREEYYLFVGRLSNEKGVKVLIDAWSQAGDKKLIVAGDGPELVNIQRSLNKNIQLIGHQSKSQVISLMKKCKALIFPSIWYEGLPMTAIEALATGTPIIGSEIGAIEEIIIPGFNGLLFTPGDRVALIKAIDEFERQSKKNNMSFYDNARKSYLEKYDTDKNYNAIMQLYNSIVNPTKDNG